MTDPSLPEPPIDPDSIDWLARVRAALEQLQARGRTMTYLELADHLGLPGPHRIHRLTQWLELTMAEDASMNRVPRATRVISRTGSGLPAAGFFAHAKALGMMGNQSDVQAYRRWRALLDQERSQTTGALDNG